MDKPTNEVQETHEFVRETHEFVRETWKSCAHGDVSLHGIKFFPLYSSDIWSPTASDCIIFDKGRDFLDSDHVTEIPWADKVSVRLNTESSRQPSHEGQATEFVSSVHTFSKLLRLPAVSDAVSLIVRKSKDNQLVIEDEPFTCDANEVKAETWLGQLQNHEACGMLEEEKNPHTAIPQLRRTLSANAGGIQRKQLGSIRKVQSRDNHSSDSPDAWIQHMECAVKHLVASIGHGRDHLSEGRCKGAIPLPSSEKWDADCKPLLQHRLLSQLRKALAKKKGKNQMLQKSFGKFKLRLINDIACFALNDIVQAAPNNDINIAVQCVNYLAESGGRPDAVDLWLEAALSDSSHVAICYTNPSDLRLAKIVGREVLLSHAKEMGLNPASIPLLEKQMSASLRLLDFLSENCHRSKRYWLYKSDAAATAMLVDLQAEEENLASDALSSETDQCALSVMDNGCMGASLCLKFTIRSRLARQTVSIEKVANLLQAERALITRGLQSLEGGSGFHNATLKSALLTALVQLNLDELNTLRFPPLKLVRANPGSTETYEWEERIEEYMKVALSLKEALQALAIIGTDWNTTKNSAEVNCTLEHRAQIDQLYCQFCDHLRTQPLMELISQSLSRGQRLSRAADDSSDEHAKSATDSEDLRVNAKCINMFIVQILSVFCTLRLMNLSRCQSSMLACSESRSSVQVEAHTAHFVLANYLIEMTDIGLFFLTSKWILPFFDIREAVQALKNPSALQYSFETILHGLPSEKVKPFVHLYAFLHPALTDPISARELLTYVGKLGDVVKWDDLWRLDLRTIWTELSTLCMTSLKTCELNASGQTFELFAGLLCEWSNNELLQESSWVGHRASRLTLCLSRYIIALAFSLLRRDHTAMSAILANLSLVFQLLSTQYKINLEAGSDQTFLFSEEQYDAYRSAIVCCALGGILADKRIVEAAIDHKETLSLIRRHSRDLGALKKECDDDHEKKKGTSDRSGEIHSWVLSGGSIRNSVHQASVAESLSYRLKVKAAYHTLAAGVDLVQYLPHQRVLFPTQRVSRCDDSTLMIDNATSTIDYWCQVEKFIEAFNQHVQEKDFLESFRCPSGPGSSQVMRSIKYIVAFVTFLLRPSLLMHLSRDIENSSLNGVCLDEIPAAMLSLLSHFKLHQVCAPLSLKGGNEIIGINTELDLIKLAIKHLLASIDMFTNLRNFKEKAVAHYYLGRVYHHQAMLACQRDAASHSTHSQRQTRMWTTAIKHLQLALNEFNPWACGIDFINSLSRMLELLLARGTDLRAALALGIAGEAILVSGKLKKKTDWANAHMSFLMSQSGKCSGVVQIRPWLQKLAIASLKISSSGLLSTTASVKARDKPYVVMNGDSLEDLASYCKTQLYHMTHHDLKELSLLLLRNQSPFQWLRIKVF